MRKRLVGTGTMIVAALLVATVTAGCGGDGSAKSDSAPSTVAGGRPSPAVGPDSEDFCGLIRTYSARLGGLTQATATPDQVRDLSEELTSALKSAADVAPAELKADVTVLTGAAEDYLAKLKDAGYDLSKLPPDATQAFSAPD